MWYFEDLGSRRPSEFDGLAYVVALADSDIPEEDEEIQTTILSRLI